MINTTEMQQALFDATKILSEKSDSDAKYAYTVKCSIKGAQNAGFNLYYVEYGANTFTACASDGASYEVNDIVYALVPESDFGQELQIIGGFHQSFYVYTR